MLKEWSFCGIQFLSEKYSLLESYTGTTKELLDFRCDWFMNLSFNVNHDKWVPM